MKKPVIIIGLGEIGGVFARAFLKAGYPVVPVTRDMDIGREAKEIADPQSVVVAVGEKDFHLVMEHIPQAWRDRLVLLQNELLPRDWKKHHLDHPTVISVWFEKKKPSDYKVIIPSPVYGPQAEFIRLSLESIGIPCAVLADEKQLTFELVVKNLYILTSNICGLSVGGTVGALWKDHEKLARDAARDILEIQFSLIGEKLNAEQLIGAMVKAFEGDLDHKCMGRSAKDRLKRALEQAQGFHLDVPQLKQISSKLSA